MKVTVYNLTCIKKKKACTHAVYAFQCLVQVLTHLHVVQAHEGHACMLRWW